MQVTIKRGQRQPSAPDCQISDIPSKGKREYQRKPEDPQVDNWQLIPLRLEAGRIRATEHDCLPASLIDKNTGANEIVLQLTDFEVGS